MYFCSFSSNDCCAWDSNLMNEYILNRLVYVKEHLIVSGLYFDS